MSLCDTCIHKKTCRFYKDLGDGIDKCNDYHNVKDFLYLPCKPGDVVYALFKNRRSIDVRRCIVNEISLSTPPLSETVVLDVDYGGYVASRHTGIALSEWNNTLFSSQTDAEKAKEALRRNG